MMGKCGYLPIRKHKYAEKPRKPEGLRGWKLLFIEDLVAGAGFIQDPTISSWV